MTRLGTLAVGIWLSLLLCSLHPSVNAVQAASQTLSQEIAAILARYQLNEAAVSIDVIDPKTGRPLYRFHPHQALKTASVMKVVTAIAAYETFGPNH